MSLVGFTSDASSFQFPVTFHCPASSRLGGLLKMKIFANGNGGCCLLCKGKDIADELSEEQLKEMDEAISEADRNETIDLGRFQKRNE